MKKETIHVVIADDQSLFRSGMESLLATIEGIEVVGTAANGQEALDAAVRCRPDIVLMDLKMPILDGVRATSLIRQQCPSVKVVVLSTFDTDECIVDALQAGAVAYLTKDCSREELRTALHVAARNEGYLQPSITKTVVNAFNRLTSRQTALTQFDLSKREQEVLERMAKGHTNQTIAEQLFISVGTVKNHITQILSKLGAENRTQAGQIARDHCLIE